MPTHAACAATGRMACAPMLRERVPLCFGVIRDGGESEAQLAPRLPGEVSVYMMCYCIWRSTIDLACLLHSHTVQLQCQHLSCTRVSLIAFVGCWQQLPTNTWLLT